MRTDETWEQTKARFKRDFNINIEKELVPEVPRARYDEPPPEPKVPLYEIRKITLPVDPKFPQGKIIFYGVTLAEANYWLEKERFSCRSYQDDKTESKTLVFYEKFLIDGTPKERNIYSNPERFCTEDFPEFKSPRRVN